MCQGNNWNVQWKGMYHMNGQLFASLTLVYTVYSNIDRYNGKLEKNI
jgi:hypothetical protein